MKHFCWLLLLVTISAVSPIPGRAATLFKSDFNTPGASAWPDATAFSASRLVSTSVALRPVGTVDDAGSVTPSGGLLLTARASGSQEGRAAIISGLLPVQNSETNPGKLTLSFSLSVSDAKPVTVRVESFDAAKRRTGGLSGLIFPAAPDFFQHYALDLSTLKPLGNGRFQPTAPFVQLTFESGEIADAYQLRLDNVNYASPAFYVSPKGSDTNDGRTEKNAFATPQKALDAAQPGGIILLMDGIYHAELNPVAAFVRPGAPDAWIVLKNYPGQNPTLTSNGWNIVSIAKGSKEKPSDDPALAYLEVRGLHVRGEGDVAKTKYPDAMNQADSRTNSNGISVDSRYANAIFHDIRIADNLVEFAPGGGISDIDGDWVTVENNVCRSNCWTTIYATSGISVMGSANFDGQSGVYKRLVRNNICCHNQTYEKWKSLGRYSDGNGIILDVNQKSDAHPTVNYLGRTLVQSNLSYDNGGSGIHAVRADHVDIIGNTAYLNSASVHLEYGEIFAVYSNDVRITNNILVAPIANLAAGEKPESVNALGGKNTDIVFSHNLYFGGNIAPTLGEGDKIGDPKFVRPSRDHKTADFHLKPESPALGKGVTLPISPFLDLDGKPRRSPPAEGAYEKGRGNFMPSKINVALVGLGFGSCFAEIYQNHPDVGALTLCDTDPERLASLASQVNAARTARRLADVLADPDIDAVHLNSGIPDHARHAIAVLDSGKHCACTVPMATSLDDIRAVIAAKRRSGRNYMMMETQAYAREFLFACELRDQGVFGHFQLLRGAHYQDMENWPPYWAGLPPMWYATHAVAPCLAFAQTRAVRVRCLGSGAMRDELKSRYDNPFPLETALFELERDEPLVMEITRALFHSARGYAESFYIYGEDATLEAAQIEGEEAPVLFRLSALGASPGPRRSRHERLYVPDYAHRLPEELRAFTGAVALDGRGAHPSVMHGGGHGGSHPHLVHEFVRSVVENRPPAIDAVTAANWSAPGICAHESARQNGAPVEIPSFE